MIPCLRGSHPVLCNQSSSFLIWSPGGEGELLQKRKCDINCPLGWVSWGAWSDCFPLASHCFPCDAVTGLTVSWGRVATATRRNAIRQGAMNLHRLVIQGWSKSAADRRWEDRKSLVEKARRFCFPTGFGEKLSIIFNCKIAPWWFAFQLALEGWKLAWGVPLMTLLQVVFVFSFLMATLIDDKDRECMHHCV